MAGTPKEIHLEESIVKHLISQPLMTIAGEALVDEAGEQMYEYHQIDNSEYDRDICVVRSEVVQFLKDTQPEEWKRLVEDTMKASEKYSMHIDEITDSVIAVFPNTNKHSIQSSLDGCSRKFKALGHGLYALAKAC